MFTIKDVKKVQLQARKDKDKFKVNVLTALLSDITMIGKNDGQRDTTDAEGQKVVVKFKKSVQETIDSIQKKEVKETSDSEKIELLKQEIDIYDEFLPKVMSERETQTAIDSLINDLESDGIKPNKGNIMPKLRLEYGASIDMKLVSQLVKKILN